MIHNDYKRLDDPVDPKITERCPCCGSEGQLWQYSESETSPTQKLVMCANGERFGPQDGMVGEGCPLYMPNDNFYRPTIKDAVRYWNEFSKALTEQRRLRLLGTLPMLDEDDDSIPDPEPLL